MPIAHHTASSVRRQAGFSLLELMVALTVAAVLLSLGIPGFTKMIKDNRRTTIVNELNFTVMTARAEAAKRGQPVTICGLTSGGGESCTGGTTWDYGWMAFVDVNGNGAIDSGDLVLRKFTNDYASKIKVRSSTGGATSGHIFLMPFNQTSTLASLLVCDDRGATEARVVCVGANGRAGSQTTNCTTGAALTCP